MHGNGMSFLYRFRTLAKMSTFQLPFFVMIATNGVPACGGTLVGPRIVLTAAHCLYNYESARWFDDREIEIIRSDFTDESWSRNSQSHPIKKFVPHERFEPHVLLCPYDIALVQFEDVFEERDQGNQYLQPCPFSQDDSTGMGFNFLQQLRKKFFHRTRLGVIETRMV